MRTIFFYHFLPEIDVVAEVFVHWNVIEGGDFFSDLSVKTCESPNATHVVLGPPCRRGLARGVLSSTPSFITVPSRSCKASPASPPPGTHHDADHLLTRTISEAVVKVQLDASGAFCSATTTTVLHHQPACCFSPLFL